MNKRILAKSVDEGKMKFTQVPKSQWVNNNPPANMIDVFVNSDFLVQVYNEDGQVRLSINRTQNINGRWVDGITWDELQAIKNAVGFADKCAIEIYPPVKDVVNVANIRHLWIFEPSFMWRR